MNNKILLMAALLVSAAVRVDGRQTADDLAGAFVIGQAYTSGNVYVGGFVGDGARAWPRRVSIIALRTPGLLSAAADFSRAVPTDSDEQHYFSLREDGGSAGPDDLFSTIDSMPVTDANLALYRAASKISRPIAIIGWDDRLQITDVSFRDKELPRPVTQAEQLEIDSEKQAIPKDFECTTEPRYLDSARVMLTAKAVKTNASIRLSRFETPGCAGHLSEVYVLDILEAGRPPRRFEFRHYVGLM